MMAGIRFTLHQLAELVDAQVIGDDQTTLSGVAKLESAGPEHLAFCTGSRYLNQLKQTRAGAVLLKKEHADYCPVPALIVDDPYYAYAVLAHRLCPRPRGEPGVHPAAVVGENVVLEEGVSIGPGAFIGHRAHIGRDTDIGAGAFVGADAVVGADSRLAPGAHLGDGCSVGERTLLHAGVVIGADGFGFAPHAGLWQKVPQLGAVRIGNDVEIGANSTIDRGALEDTVVEDGVKLDNLVHIGHNSHIGAHTAIAGCTVVAGSTIIGKHCVIGGQSAITGHIEICDGVTVMGMTSVTGSIREPGVYSSPIPARPVKEWRRNAVRFTQLDDIFRRVGSLERHFEDYQPVVSEH